MPVETAEDLASFFNTDEFAVVAKYRPQQGIEAEVAVIFDNRDVDLGGGFNGVQTTSRRATIRASDIDSLPARGDRLEIDDNCYEVKKATAAVGRNLYICDLIPAKT